ncbi:MAG: HNH endonuclease [Vulcanimicrobiota bacterium]
MAPSTDTLLSSGYNEIAADEKQYKETVDDPLTHGLSGPEVHRRALEARKLFGKAQKALTFWINEIDTRKIYREFGCSSIYHYATTHLALGEHTIAEFLRTGKALEHLPLLSQAYEKGEISSTHVREITRVATPETESFWYEAAKKSTTRQIEKLVAFSPKGGLPPAQLPLPTKAPNLSQAPHPSQAQLPAQAPNLSQTPFPSQITFSTAPGGIHLPAIPGDKPLPGASGNTAIPTVADDTLLPTTPGDTTLNPAGLRACDLEPQNGSGEIIQGRDDDVNNQAERNQQKKQNDNAVTEPTGSVTAPVKYHDKLIVELSGEEMSIVKDALDRARKESGLRDRKSLLLFIVKSFLDGTVTSGRETRKPPYQILLHHHLPSGLTWSDTLKGEMPVSPNVLEKALCDAELIEVDEPDCSIQDLAERPARDLHEGEEKAEGCCRECSGRESSGRESSGKESSGPSKDGLSRVNRLYKIYKERSRNSENRDKHSGGNDNAQNGSRRRSAKTEKTISDAMRKKVLKRDGHKCQRPGCGRTYFLEVHHIEPEGAGGATEEKNLCTSCTFCHDLVHESRLSVEGEAPHKLAWRDERGQLL